MRIPIDQIFPGLARQIVFHALHGDAILDRTNQRAEIATYALVLIDVEGEHGIAEAEKLCGDIKTAKHEQLVAFVCNWRVAILTDCPDEIVRTEFDPAAFAAGVEDILNKH